MNTVMQSIIKSYARGVLVAITPLLATGQSDPWMYICAIFAGVIGPALRAVDKKDPAFGLIADAVEVELHKLATRSKKKTAKKK
jgi:hypothetical protein